MLAALIRPLRSGSGGAIDRYDLGRGQRLFIGDRAIDRAGLREAWLAGWQDSSPIVSCSSTDTLRGMLTANADRAGLDLETVSRVSANTDIEDHWLSDDERAQIARSVSPALEIACHWVLKEAYGKALGVGLALPLAALTFRRNDRDIVLTGAAAPPSGAGWTFRLWQHDALLVATAVQRAPSDDDAVRTGRQEATHLAP